MSALVESRRSVWVEKRASYHPKAENAEQEEEETGQNWEKIDPKGQLFFHFDHYIWVSHSGHTNLVVIWPFVVNIVVEFQFSMRFNKHFFNVRIVLKADKSINRAINKLQEKLRWCWD